jgi:uncharacterized protein (DUF952 family)
VHLIHVTPAAVWEAFIDAENNADYFAPDDYDSTGFIHLCTKEQLPFVLNKFFAAEEQVVVLYLLEKKIREKVRYEAGEPGQLFPHLYSTIPLTAIADLAIYDKMPDGSWEQA